MPGDKKTFVISVDALIFIGILIAIILFGCIWKTSDRVTLLEEKVGYLEDTDADKQELRSRLFEDVIRSKNREVQ